MPKAFQINNQIKESALISVNLCQSKKMTNEPNFLICKNAVSVLSKTVY